MILQRRDNLIEHDRQREREGRRHRDRTTKQRSSGTLRRVPSPDDCDARHIGAAAPAQPWARGPCRSKEIGLRQSMHPVTASRSRQGSAVHPACASRRRPAASAKHGNARRTVISWIDMAHELTSLSSLPSRMHRAIASCPASASHGTAPVPRLLIDEAMRSAGQRILDGFLAIGCRAQILVRLGAGPGSDRKLLRTEGWLRISWRTSWRRRTKWTLS